MLDPRLSRTVHRCPEVPYRAKRITQKYSVGGAGNSMNIDP